MQNQVNDKMKINEINDIRGRTKQQQKTIKRLEKYTQKKIRRKR